MIGPSPPAGTPPPGWQLRWAGCEGMPLASPVAVRAVYVDQRPAAPAGERAAHAGRPDHHLRHHLLHRVCQQHGHHHHLPARPGGAGEGPSGDEGEVRRGPRVSNNTGQKAPPAGGISTRELPGHRSLPKCMKVSEP